MKKCKKNLVMNCTTCELNMGVCAGKHYGKPIGDKPLEENCDGWSCSMSDFMFMKCDGKCNLKK